MGSKIGEVNTELTLMPCFSGSHSFCSQRTRGMGSKIGELIIAPIYANLPSDMQVGVELQFREMLVASCG